MQKLTQRRILFLLGALLMATMVACSSDDPAAPEPDTDPPSVVAVLVQVGDQVEIDFSEAVDAASATNPANYDVKDITVAASDDHVAARAPVAGAVLTGGTRVTLTTSFYMEVGRAYEVSVSGVKDVASNTMENVTRVAENKLDDVTPPAIESTVAVERDEVIVVFSERVRKETAEDLSNYSVVDAPGREAADRLQWQGPPRGASVAIEVIGVSLRSDGLTAVVETAGMDVFASYNVTVSGVKDLVGNDVAATTRPVENRVKSGRIYTIAGTGLPALGDENIDPTESELYLPQDMTIGPGGLLYVVDWNNHRIRVIENGLIRTVLGSGLLGDADPGEALDVSFNHPTNVQFDHQGRMIVAAWHNSKIMRFDMTTGLCDVYCNWRGARSYAGDGGPARDATVNLPSATGIDAQGRVVIADQANFVIRRISLSDEISTVAGRGTPAGYCGDGGPAIDACLSNPLGQNASPAGRIEFDASYNLYIADTLNHRIRRIDGATWIIDTVVGSGDPGFSGDGGSALDAQLKSPADVAVGPDGSVYFVDTSNHCVRRVTPGGIITTIAGRGEEPGYGGDGGRATDALLKRPFGVMVDSFGNVYIADTENHRIRIAYQ